MFSIIEKVLFTPIILLLLLVSEIKAKTKSASRWFVKKTLKKEEQKILLERLQDAVSAREIRKEINSVILDPDSGLYKFYRFFSPSCLEESKIKEKEYEAIIDALIKECEQAGISHWQIKTFLE
jgi:hypothetical protein